MELIEGLLTRRSVRRFLDKKVEDKDIFEVIETGMYAPSAHNQRPWSFICVTDKDDLVYLSEHLQYAKMAKGAAFAIIICADIKDKPTPEYWQQDCSASIQNMLLACHGKGLGAVWVGMHPHKDKEDVAKNRFNIPEDIFVHSILVGGYPEKAVSEAHRFDETKIHKNKW